MEISRQINADGVLFQQYDKSRKYLSIFLRNGLFHTTTQKVIINATNGRRMFDIFLRLKVYLIS